MTDYNALAQRIEKQLGNRWRRNYFETGKGFCQDGRVVLALMEKWCKRYSKKIEETYGQLQIVSVFEVDSSFAVSLCGNKFARADSLALALVEACLDALEFVDDK